jgi:hypothetical protein
MEWRKLSSSLVSEWEIIEWRKLSSSLVLLCLSEKSWSGGNCHLFLFSCVWVRNHGVEETAREDDSFLHSMISHSDTGEQEKMTVSSTPWFLTQTQENKRRWPWSGGNCHLLLFSCVWVRNHGVEETVIFSCIWVRNHRVEETVIFSCSPVSEWEIMEWRKLSSFLVLQCLSEKSWSGGNCHLLLFSCIWVRNHGVEETVILSCSPVSEWEIMELRKLSSSLVLLYLSVLAHLSTLLVLLVNFLCLWL